jgi:phosphoribosylformylglycinamidine synthase
VAEAARNLACTGAVPLGVTDNLNFGNPYKPDIFWQLRESVRGLAEACRAFNAPVTGGNVSLYNQSPAGPIDPTPTVAMVGLIEQPEHITTQWFKDEGDAIILLGERVDLDDPLQGLGGSAYLQRMHGLKTGTPPRCDLEKEKNLHLALRALIHTGCIKSAHDCSEGGLAVALAESCISQQVARETPCLIGAKIDLSPTERPAVSAGQASSRAADSPAEPVTAKPGPAERLDALLFGETQGRIVVSTAPLDAVKVVERAKLLGVSAVRIGTVGGDSLALKTEKGEFTWTVGELYDLWWNSIARAMKE